MAKYNLSKGKPSDFRIIPAFDEKLKKYLNQEARKFHLGWYDKITGRFDTPRKVIITHEKDYQALNTDAITLDWSGDDIMIKSNKKTSNHISTELSNDQKVMLHYFFDILKPFILDGSETPYNKVRKRLDQHFGVSPEFSNLYNTLHFDNKQWFYENDVVDDEDGEYLSEFNNILNDTSFEKDDRKIAIQEALENGRRPAAAFLWHNQDEADDILSFATGNTLKTKRGLQKNLLEYHKTPVGFIGVLRGLAQELYYLTGLSESRERFEKIRALIMDNIDVMNKGFHYLCVDTYAKTYLYLATISPHYVEATFHVKKVEESLVITRKLTIDGKPIDNFRVLVENEFFLATETKIHFYCDYLLYKIHEFFEELNSDSIHFYKQDYDRALAFLDKLETHFTVVYDSPITPLEKIEIENPSMEILLREIDKHITFEPRMRIADQTFNIYEDDMHSLKTVSCMSSEKRTSIL